MKRLILAVLVAAIGTTAIAKNSGEKASKVSVRTNMEASTMNLIYRDNAPSLITVTIMDAHGKTVAKDQIKNANGFNQPYDLSNLASGIYTVTMADGQGEFFNTTAVVSNALSAVKPTDESKYQLTFEDTQTQRVSVGIYDDRGKLIFKETVRSDDGFSKVYNLSEIDSEHYTFEVTSVAKVETHTL